MRLKQGDRVTLRSNKNVLGGLRPGDEGIVVCANADKGYVDVLWKNGFRTTHVSWPSRAGRCFFLSTDLLAVSVVDDKELPAHPGYHPRPKDDTKARPGTLLDEMKKVELVERATRLLSSSCGAYRALYLVWLLEVLESETSGGDDPFREMLENLRDHITARLEVGVWQDLPPREG